MNYIELEEILKSNQKVLRIGNVEIGGRPGEYPTVIVTSMFYRRHKIVLDHLEGVFDVIKAKDYVLKLNELSSEFGNPAILDIEAYSLKAMTKYIDFTSNLTNFPLLINSPIINVRLMGVKYAFEIGLGNRVIYASINYNLTPEEEKHLTEIGLKSALIQTFNPRNPLPTGMLNLLISEGLLSKVFEIGVSNPLIFINVFDVPGIGVAINGLRLLKAKLGYPVGTAPSGVIGSWLKNSRFNQRVSRTVIRNVGAILTQLNYADFIHVGSIRFVESAYPAIALIDALTALRMINLGFKPKLKNHPIYKLNEVFMSL